jgi:hypothetical protein
MAPNERVGALVVEAAELRPLEVVETHEFGKDARKIFTEEELCISTSAPSESLEM